MWLFTLSSFVSVVRHRDDKTILLVRARRRDDLVELLGPKWERQIINNPQADYRWRVMIPEKTFKSVVSRYITKRLDYDNFKTAQKQDPRFSHFLNEVWEAGDRMLHSRKKIDMEDFQDILRKYQQDEKSNEFKNDVNSKKDDWYFWPRFERALSNQCGDGDATFARWAIWVDDVHDLITQAKIHLKKG